MWPIPPTCTDTMWPTPPTCTDNMWPTPSTCTDTMWPTPPTCTDTMWPILHPVLALCGQPLQPVWIGHYVANPATCTDIMWPTQPKMLNLLDLNEMSCIFSLFRPETVSGNLKINWSFLGNLELPSKLQVHVIFFSQGWSGKYLYQKSVKETSR